MSIKIAWICNFSNAKVQQRLNLGMNFLQKLVRVIQKKDINVCSVVGEYSPWVTNGIDAIEKCSEDIELHIISPCKYLKTETQEFELGSIHYHFFSDEYFLFSSKIRNAFFRSSTPSFKHNRRCIAKFICKIKPSIVNLIGAENPFYSMSVLDIPRDIPVIVQLQTLMNDPNFEKNFPISHESYVFRSSIEKKILNRADYIGTTVTSFRKIISQSHLSSAKTIAYNLAVSERINKDACENKEYDFVYFSAYIEKAVDLAVEAFIRASQKKTGMSLLIVGGYQLSTREKLNELLKKAGLLDNVFFTGMLPTREDVLMKIRKAKVALLPLKIDFIPGTIREAMANGLPVVSTVTEGTPLLNTKRLSILLSEKENIDEMSSNMLRLLADASFAQKIKENAFLTIEERYENKDYGDLSVRVYKAVYDEFYNGIPMPEDLLCK